LGAQGQGPRPAQAHDRYERVDRGSPNSVGVPRHAVGAGLVEVAEEAIETSAIVRGEHCSNRLDDNRCLPTFTMCCGAEARFVVPGSVHEAAAALPLHVGFEFGEESVGSEEEARGVVDPAAWIEFDSNGSPIRGNAWTGDAEQRQRQ